MANWSPFAPGTPGLVPIAGPNGTFQVPAAMAPAFGVQGTPPPTAPLPTFAPEELAPPAPPPPAPAPAPQPFALTEEENATLPAPSQPAQPQQPAAPPPPAPGSLTAQLANVEHQKDIALRQGAVDADVADQEAAALRAANEEEKRLTAERDAERARQQKEIAAARASQADALDAFVNHKVDQGRLWAGKSTGQKILAGIGVALSGIGGALVARDTGRHVTNPALDMIMGAIQDDVRLQMADRDKLGQVVGMRRQAVDDLRAQYSDGEAAYNAIVAGRTRQVANQIAAIGASAKSEKAKLGAEAAVTQLNEVANQHVQTAIAKEDAAKQQAFDNRLRQSSNALGWAGFKAGEMRDKRDFEEGKRRFDAQLEAEYAFKLAEARKAELAGQAAAAKEMREQARLDRQLKKDEFDQEIQIVARKVYDPHGNELKDKDGINGLFLAGDEKRAGELQKMIGNTTTMTQLTDEMVRLREKHGWSSDLFRSPEWQQMKSTFANMQLTEKDVRTLGALTGSDLTILASVLGTDDPTGVRDPTPGLRQFRKNAENGLNNELRGKGYKGERITFPELTSIGVQNEAGTTPVGQLVTQVQERSKDPIRTTRISGVRGGESISRDALTPIGDALARTPGLSQYAPAGASRISGFEGAPVPSEAAERAVWGLVAVAGTGNEQAKRALQVMADDKNPRIRELVRQVATQNPGLGITVKK